MKQSGFTITEILITLAVTGIIGASLAVVSQMARSSDNKSSMLRVVLQERTSIRAALMNQASWATTVSKTESLSSCLISKDDCSLSSDSSGFYSLVIYDIDSKKISWDQNDKTTLKMANGNSCSANEQNEANCPIKFSARWKPICTVYPCKNPLISIDVSLQISKTETKTAEINTEPFSFSMLRSMNDNSVSSLCASIKGIYDVNSGSCLPAAAGKTCASIGKPFEVLQSVAENGTITCRPIRSGACNALTEVVKGLDASGKVICAPKTCGTTASTPTPTPTPASICPESILYKPCQDSSCQTDDFSCPSGTVFQVWQVGNVWSGSGGSGILMDWSGGLGLMCVAPSACVETAPTLPPQLCLGVPKPPKPPSPVCTVPGEVIHRCGSNWHCNASGWEFLDKDFCGTVMTKCN